MCLKRHNDEHKRLLSKTFKKSFQPPTFYSVRIEGLMIHPFAFQKQPNITSESKNKTEK